jgi:hypothetical protein
MPRQNSRRACSHCGGPMPHGSPCFRSRRCAHCGRQSGINSRSASLRATVKRLECGVDRRHLSTAELTQLRGLLQAALRQTLARDGSGMQRKRRLSHNGMSFALSYTNLGRVIVSTPSGFPVAASTYFAV